MKYLIAFLVCILLLSCTFTSTNSIADKEAAEKVLKGYFYNLVYDSIGSNDSLYSDEFYKKTPKDKLHKIEISLKNKLGVLEDYKLDKWETVVVSGTESSSEYGLVYKMKYAKDSATEIFKLRKDDKGKIKIYYHNISSPAILE